MISLVIKGSSVGIHHRTSLRTSISMNSLKSLGLDSKPIPFTGSSVEGEEGVAAGGKPIFLGGAFFQELLKEFSEREEVDGIYELPLTSGEAYWGTEKQIIIDSIGEQKKFFIQIPRGVRPGTLLRVVLNESKDGEILLRVRII